MKRLSEEWLRRLEEWEAANRGSVPANFAEESLPALLSEVRELRAEVERARGAVEAARLAVGRATLIHSKRQAVLDLELFRDLDAALAANDKERVR